MAIARHVPERLHADAHAEAAYIADSTINLQLLPAAHKCPLHKTGHVKRRFVTYASCIFSKLSQWCSVIADDHEHAVL